MPRGQRLRRNPFALVSGMKPERLSVERSSLHEQATFKVGDQTGHVRALHSQHPANLMAGASRDAPPDGVEQAPLFTDRLAALARSGHPLAGRRVSLNDPQRRRLLPEFTKTNRHARNWIGELCGSSPRPGL